MLREHKQQKQAFIYVLILERTLLWSYKPFIPRLLVTQRFYLMTFDGVKHALQSVSFKNIARAV